MPRLLLALAPALGLVLAGCPSSVRIVTEPPGAHVRVDGQPLGPAPVVYTDVAPVGTTHYVEVSLQGYQTTQVVFSRNARIQPAAVCAGMICLLPWAWALDYPDRLVVPLRPEGPAGRRAPPPASDDPLDRPPYEGWDEPAPLSAPPPPPPEDARVPPPAAGDAPAPEAEDPGDRPAPPAPPAPDGDAPAPL